jgi:P-type Cu+ transporter
MTFKRAVAGAGYQVLEISQAADETTEDRERAAREKEMNTLTSKFIFAAVLSIPIFLGSYPEWFPWLPPLLKNWVFVFLLVTPVQFWSGWQFYRGAWAAAKHKTSDMNTLIAIGTSAAYLYSAAVTFFPQLFPAGMDTVYYDTSSIIIALILLGASWKLAPRARLAKPSAS